jgi:uncharacterized membrane protein (UPF0127 family)
MNKKAVWVLGILFILIVLLFVFKNSGVQTAVCFSEKCFDVEIAEDDLEREEGLMFREVLREDSGMLFVFPDEDKYGFWMKNTLIPLDIIWIDENKKVIAIKENALPCEEEPCEIYVIDEKVLYVLEINAGLTEKLGVEVGDNVTLPSNYQ